MMDQFLKEEIRVLHDPKSVPKEEEDNYPVKVTPQGTAAPGAFTRQPPKNPVELRFDALSYQVSLGFRKGRKQILHEVHGRFPAGQMIAILGPSGAGKSSLLDILSGYRITGVTGTVCVNKQERNLAAFRRKSCYITQDDRLQPLLTVRENMRIAAGLKLGGYVTAIEKDLIIDEILTTLGLLDSQNTSTAMLSGGQKKRLSIALELINNPTVMFLDEPTTGLDSSSCTQCVSLLKVLARQGRTIVCTIHQPSATLFHMFDLVYVLARGHCLYQGAPEQMIPYLNTVSLPCPLYHNPADYVIELACGEYGDDKITRLVDGVDNGRITKWMAPDLIVDNSYAIVKDSSKKKALSPTKSAEPNNRGASQWSQLYLLLQRGFIKARRDPTLTHLRMIVNMLVGLMLGAIYINSGNEGDRVLDNYALLFGILMHHVMSTMMLTILTFPSEMSILKKEHFNRWYSLKSYFLSITIVDLPVSIASCLVFTVFVYFMSEQPYDVTRFAMFFHISLLMVFVAQSIGLMVGAVFNVINGTFLGPTLCVPMMMFAGFGVSLRDLPSYLKWGSYVSYLRYGLEGYVGAIYGMDRPTLDCKPGKYCHYKYPKKFLNEISMEGDQFWTDVAALTSILIITRVLAYVLLRWKLMSVR